MGRGLVLLLEGAEAKKSGILFPGGCLQPEVFDYFAGEVFNKLDKKTRGLLLKTSFLQTVTPRVAEHMSGLSDAGNMLAELNSNNFFTGRILGSLPAFRYHPLFREFLQTRASGTLTREKIALLKIEAAHLLMDEGQTEEAVDLLSAAQNWNSLVRLILENAQQLISQGRNRTLQEWIEQLPRETVDSAPWLVYWHAVCLGPFDPTESRKRFESAFELFKKEGTREGLILACLAVLESYAVVFGDFKDADRWINELEDVVKHKSGFTSLELEIRVTFTMFTILYMARPDHLRFSFWFERAKSLMPSCRDNSQRVINAGFLLNYYSWTSFPADTSSLINELQLAMKAPDVPPAIRIMGKLMSSIHEWATASFDACRKTVAEGLEIAAFHGIHHNDWKLYAHAIFSATILGDCASSELMHKMAAATNFDNPIEASSYHLQASLDARCREDFSSSLEHARVSEKLAAAGGSPFALALMQYNLSQALYHACNRVEARECAEKALRIARMMKSHLIEFHCLLLKALFEFSEKSVSSDVKGLTMLRRALLLGKELTMMNILGWRRKTLAGLCARALDAGIEREYTIQLIAAHRLEPHDPTAVSEAWPWPLKINTLGKFEILKDGKPIEFAGKLQKRPLQMLKFLIAAGCGMQKERLIDMLWPDGEGDAGVTAFHTTLSRLRRLVGNDYIIQLKEGNVSIDRNHCWVDIRIFEHLCEQTDKFIKEQSENVTLIRQSADTALALYKGHFLVSETDHQFAIPVRERLKSKYLRLIVILGGYFEKAGDIWGAVDYYTKGLESDHLAEDLYQRVMNCYLRVDRKAEALTVYERCRKVLFAELGVPPSQRTEAIRQEILNS